MQKAIRLVTRFLAKCQKDRNKCLFRTDRFFYYFIHHSVSYGVFFHASIYQYHGGYGI